MMSVKEKCFSYIDTNREKMISLWQELVNIDSGSDYKEGVDTAINKVADILRNIGGNTRIAENHNAGNMLVSEFGDTTKPFIILLGHLDTVFNKAGTAKERPFTIKDGKAFGPGALDMKGGIVILLYVLAALKQINYSRYPVKVILLGDEETAHVNSDAVNFMTKESQGAIAAFNFETGFMDDSIVVARKGVMRFSLETFGRSAHVGNDPENGRSAIKELAHKILDIEALTDWTRGINLNVGVIEGGTVANAAPAYAKMICDMRYTTPEIVPEKLAQFKAITDKVYVQGVTTKLEIISEMPPMVYLDTSKELFELVKSIYEEEDFGHPKAITVGGGSDSAYTTAAGIPTMCAMGVKGARNHTVEEFADVESLFMRAKLMIAILLRL